jgi:pyruvate ferredoxin oxidoreductase alpha subunit
VRYLAHYKQECAMERIPRLAQEFQNAFGREAGGLLHTYKCEDAETIVVAMGSICGTIKDVIDEMREQGHKLGVVVIGTYRPFPFAALRKSLQSATKIIVAEKSLTAGMGGPLAADVTLATQGLLQTQYSIIAGLGGRPITKVSLKNAFVRAQLGELPNTTFLDLNWQIVNEQIERAALPTPMSLS